MKIEETIRGLGFGASLTAPVAAKAKAGDLEVQAQARKSVKRGKSGDLMVGLFPGSKLSDVKVSVSGKGFKASTESVGTLGKKKVVKVKLGVEKSAETGDQDVTVTITFKRSELEAIEIKVPVEVR